MKKKYFIIILAFYIANSFSVFSQVVHTNFFDFWHEIHNPFLEIDFDGDSISEIIIQNDNIGGALGYPMFTENTINTTILTGGNLTLTPLVFGEIIDATSSVWTQGGFSNVNLPFSIVNNTDFFVGIQFNIASNTHYGWIRANWDDISGVLYVDDFAYEVTPNLGILAGDTNSLNINDEELSTTSISPNPFNNFIKIDINPNLEIASSIIYTIDGKIIMQDNHHYVNTNYINTESLYRGIYLLRIITKNGKSITKKIIKE